jgi:endonuclease YncB( thermonuclease family)
MTVFYLINVILLLFYLCPETKLLIGKSGTQTDSSVTLHLEIIMEREEECELIRLLPDGSPMVKLRGVEQNVRIYGIEIPQPPPDQYIEIMTRRLPRIGKPLRCLVRSTDPPGPPRVKFFYYGWQDKSGGVWLDLALMLIDEGLVKVAPEDFSEREEYLKHEQAAQSRSKK